MEMKTDGDRYLCPMCTNNDRPGTVCRFQQTRIKRVAPPHGKAKAIIVGCTGYDKRQTQEKKAA